MITINQAHDTLKRRLGQFREGTDLSINRIEGMRGVSNDNFPTTQERVELVLEWNGVELKSKGGINDSALFLVRCQSLETAGIFADLGAAVAEFNRQCVVWEAQHATQ